MFAQGWFAQNSGTNKELFDVHFADTQHGWIASQTNTILYTSDGGNTWVDLQPPPSVNYWGIYFVSALEGWAVGSPGKIRHTTDGGITWEDQTGTSYDNWDVHFIDEHNGWVAGGRPQGPPGQDPIRYIYHTANGGDFWSSQLYDINEPYLRGIHFFDTNIGYAVGEGGQIFHTTNGGSNWFEQASGTLRNLYSVHASTPDTAWAVGVQGLVLRTTNGGGSWDSIYVGTLHSFGSVYFVDAMTGWIAGGDTIQGTIVYTTDGGDTWVLQNTGTPNALFSVYFTDADTGWAVGHLGTILHTTTGGTAVEEIGNIKQPQTDVTLSQNNPNPFSRTTVIRFALPKAGQVDLKVYDLIGQEVATLINGERQAGEHSVVFDGQDLPNGVYFYRLNIGDVTRTKLCVLMN
jgi:photosystem II stability/assembly factor-like uncharacterized protein